MCALCTAIRRVGALFHAKGALPPMERILFLKLTEMGATVLARAAFERASTMVGRENVYLLTLEENRPITELVGLIPPENILSIHRGSLPAFALDGLRKVWKVRRMRFSATIDLEFFMRATAVIAWLSGAPRRVGLHRFNLEAPYRGDLMTHPMLYNPHIHTAQLYDAEVRALEEKPDRCPVGKFSVSDGAMEPPRFKPAEGEQERLKQKLQEVMGKPVSRPLILLNPNCNDVLPNRKWPGEHYIALAREILVRYPSANILCIGLEQDADPLDEMCRKVSPERMFSLAGKTDFRELLVLFTIADVLVSADSGPPHFAAMTGIHTVVLFGPETAKLFGPLGERTHVLSADFACSPCVTPLNQRISPCRSNECMQAIPPEAVIAEVERCLQRRDH